MDTVKAQQLKNAILADKIVSRSKLAWEAARKEKKPDKDLILLANRYWADLEKMTNAWKKYHGLME